MPYIGICSMKSSGCRMIELSRCNNVVLPRILTGVNEHAYFSHAVIDTTEDTCMNELEISMSNILSPLMMGMGAECEQLLLIKDMWALKLTFTQACSFVGQYPESSAAQTLCDASIVDMQGSLGECHMCM